MIVLGLTGSIGMGKSTAAAMLRRLGCPVSDADAIVHGLMGPRGAALPALSTLFPDAVGPAGVDRKALGAAVFGDAGKLAKLEAILHPLVARDRDRFLRTMALRRTPVVVLDVPLLFETDGDRNCDITLCVSAPDFVQTARVLARPGMTPAKLRDIRARQMPDGQKRLRADIVVPTGLGRRESLRALRRAVRLARGLAPRRWPPRGFAPGGRSR